MALQYSTPVRNARLDVVESAIGASPVLQLRTGAPPANCAAAASGSLLASDNLPADWLAAAANGVKEKLGTWQLIATAQGDIGHFRILDATGTTCHIQGRVTVDGGDGEMAADDVSVVVNQVVTVTLFQIAAGNA